ncbi:MAG: branched-chain amino acid ABC transporter permease [Sphaerochaeta sp.]|nr:branched-chain amino acid ABC transporter permease [Sphaerochaeta sp.]
MGKERRIVGTAEFFQHLMNGLTLGGIYALIALGYTMVYGILKFINFAHGDILMVGAYIGLFVFDLLRGDSPLGLWTIIAFFLAMLVSMAACGILGMTIERIAYKPLRKATRLAPLLSAIGVSFILSNSAAWMLGTQSRKFNYPFDNSSINLGGVIITPHQILILVVSLVMMLALKLFVDRTRMGKAMRATSLDQDTAMLMGINVNRVISLTFAIGSALAAVGGILIALDFKVYPSMGTMTGLKAFVAAVVGGIGNISGAMFGGILLGLLETFGVAVLGIPSGLKDTIAFGVLIIILLVKPEGLFGKVEKEKV